MLFIEWCLRSLKESKLKTPTLLKIFPSLYNYKAEQTNMNIIFSGFFKEITNNYTSLNQIINQELVILVSKETQNSYAYNETFQHIYSYGSLSPTCEFLIYFNSQYKTQEAEDVKADYNLTPKIEKSPKLQISMIKNIVCDSLSKIISYNFTIFG